jgi:hypothetical protein
LTLLDQHQICRHSYLLRRTRSTCVLTNSRAANHRIHSTQSLPSALACSIPQAIYASYFLSFRAHPGTERSGNSIQIP